MVVPISSAVGEIASKFPKPQIAAVATYHAAFVGEARIGERVNSPWIAHVVVWSIGSNR